MRATDVSDLSDSQKHLGLRNIHITGVGGGGSGVQAHPQILICCKFGQKPLKSGHNSWSLGKNISENLHKIPENLS